MDWKELGGKIAKIAPMLGTVVAGPAGGAVGGMISLVASAFGLEPDATPEKLLEAITLDPEAAVKLKEIETNCRLELAKLIIKSDEIHLQDRANARARETEIVKTTGKKDVNLYVLAWTVVVGFFALCTVLMMVKLPEGQNEVLFMLFGSLAAGFGGVLQYFFGSSKSSAEKTNLIAGKTTPL